MIGIYSNQITTSGSQMLIPSSELMSKSRVYVTIRKMPPHELPKNTWLWGLETPRTKAYNLLNNLNCQLIATLREPLFDEIVNEV